MNWLGWEYENRTGTHMIISKVHLQNENGFTYRNGDTEAVCGARIPRYASTNEGREVCKKCNKYALKNDIG